MPQNSSMIIHNPSSDDETFEIPPDAVRDGETWQNVKDAVLKGLKGYPPQVIERELKKEAALFLKGPLPITRLSQEAVRKDIEEAPRHMKRRILANWAKNWI
jgi:hypothetical protein